MKFSINSSLQHWIIGNQFATNKEATLKSFGIKSKGAEVYLFISKGTAAAEDVNEDDDQQNQYQQPVENYSTQQYNNYTQQPQGQYNTNQPHTYQQQQSYPQSQNNYNQFGIQSLPPPEPMQLQYSNYGAPHMSAGGRGESI